MAILKIESTKIIMRSDKGARRTFLKSITCALILTWQQANLYGTDDFSNLLAASDSDYSAV